MSDIHANNTDASASDDAPTKYDELPDAPPKSSLRLSMTGKVSVAIVIFWVVMAFVGPFIAPYDEAEFIEENLQGEYYDDPSFLSPNEQVYLGTDYLGRDILSRIMWGARTTIGISFIATLFAYFVGITLGIAAAVAGGWTDTILSRLDDAILSFPNIMLGLIIIAAFGSSIPLLIILAGLVYAASVYRIARALGQDIMVSDFVEAARARRGPVVDYHAGGPAERGNAACNRFRVAACLCHPVHFQPEFSWVGCAAADFGLGKHGSRKPAGAGQRIWRRSHCIACSGCSNCLADDRYQPYR